MKISLFIFTVILAITCTVSAGARLPGQTLVDGIVQKDVTSDLMVAEKALAGQCKKSRIADTKISRPPKALGVEKGTGLAVAQWTERWTIDRCGTKVIYTIHFDMRGSAGTMFKIEAPRR
jgi:hypothetical protein